MVSPPRATRPHTPLALINSFLSLLNSEKHFVQPWRAIRNDRLRYHIIVIYNTYIIFYITLLCSKNNITIYSVCVCRYVYYHFFSLLFLLNRRDKRTPLAYRNPLSLSPLNSLLSLFFSFFFFFFLRAVVPKNLQLVL